MTDIVGPLPDGSGFFGLSFPLPPSHWLFVKPLEPRPRPLFAWELHCMPRARLVEAARWSIRAATSCGTVAMDADPDAIVQNLVVALLGPRSRIVGKEEQPCPKTES